MPVTIIKPVESFSGGSQDGESVEVKRLRKTHIQWDRYQREWNFYLAAYEGGSDFANKGNLFKHTRENEQDFNDRAQRIHNLNYCEPLVDFFTNFIFSESIDRDGGPEAEFYRDFIKDVNRKKESVDDFMRQVCDESQIFGMVYILVDAPAVDRAQVLTKADEQRLGIRPYWVLVKPDEITDWVVDDFGQFVYAKRKQLANRLNGADVITVERYTEFYLDRIVVSEIDVSDAGAVRYIGSTPFDNPLGTVPLVVARYKRSKRDPHMGLSFLRDFAYNNREIVNLTSLLQEFLYRQAFNVLAKEAESGVPMNEQEEGTLGTANVIEVPKDAKFPQYISPAADPAEFIQNERQRIVNEMIKRAAQDALNELFNGEKASGFSQAQSFSKTVPFITSRADMLERVENELMELTMKMAGREWTGKIKYKDHYELTNLTDALTQLQVLVRDFALPSETFVKSELKRMVHEFDGKLPPDQLAKIEKEIDEMDFSKWMATQKQALVGRGNSPGSQQKPKDTGTMMEVAAEAKMPNMAGTKKLKPKREKS